LRFGGFPELSERLSRATRLTASGSGAVIGWWYEKETSLKGRKSTSNSGIETSALGRIEARKFGRQNDGYGANPSRQTRDWQPLRTNCDPG
jgi:hypothetical protein